LAIARPFVRLVRDATSDSVTFSLDLFHDGRVLGRDTRKLRQKGLFLVTQLSHSGSRFGERDEVFGLDKKECADKTKLAEMLDELGADVPVAAILRG
jgi:hypothetical protein